MAFTHKIFLFWLLYAVIVAFGWGILLHLGLPQIALHFDHSYLTYILLGSYLLAEVLSGRQIWKISNENRVADDAINWLAHNELNNIDLKDDGVSLRSSDGKSAHCVPRSAIGEHFSLLCVKANAGQRKIRQNTIIDITAERLYERSMIAEFLAARIVWIGILATILGVIMAFWPMLGGISLDAMRQNLGEFFSGIAIAFIPTAVSFVFKIVLDFNTRIITTGVRDLIDKIASVSELVVLPALDHEDI